MSFQNNEDCSIEFWLAEMSSLLAIRDGIEKRHANLKILESISEFIFLYESGLSVKSAFGKYKGGV
jgi:hypothetical protein